MRTVEETRNEFNDSMSPYTAVIIVTEHKPFTDGYFEDNGLFKPLKRVSYVPPPFVGADSPIDYLRALETGSEIDHLRKESIPSINHHERFLLCDDYVSGGDTFRMAMVRLVERGVALEQIWGSARNGCTQQLDETLLDTSTQWLEYRDKNPFIQRLLLGELGFKYPPLYHQGSLF